MQHSINLKTMYYLFKTEQEAITALNYVNQVGLSLFPPERVTPEGIISLNALTGLPDLNAAKTTSWDTVKELKRGEEVLGWYFTMPTDEVVGRALPPMEVPGDYEVVDQLELEEEGKALPLLEYGIVGEDKLIQLEEDGKALPPLEYGIVGDDKLI